MPAPWIFVIFIAAWMVYACLRVIAREYATAVAWHDLRVQVQRLRREQQRRVDAATRSEPSLRPTGRTKMPVASLIEPAGAVEEAVELAEAA